MSKRGSRKEESTGDVFVKYYIKLRVRDKLIANLPAEPEVLQYAVRRSRESVGLPTSDEEVEKEARELEQYLPEGMEGTLVFLRDESGLFIRERKEG